MELWELMQLERLRTDRLQGRMKGNLGRKSIPGETGC